MNSYLENILGLGRIKSNESKLKLTWMDPVAFCEELIEESLWNHKSSHSIKFTTTGSCLKALIDPSFLNQILVNVINNAILYSPIGSKITFTLNCLPNDLEFIIQDEGCGIPKEELEQIFEPFYRGASHPSVPGTGLGLFIVKRAVDLMKGDITIQSQVDAGTCVTIRVPLIQAGMEDESDSSN
jgi:signal transduction histidine kinase